MQWARIIFIIAVTSLSLRVSASNGTSCGFVSTPGFIPIKELAGTLSTQATSVEIFVLMKNGQWDECSGAVVSDQGHILTAGHCLENCSDKKEVSKDRGIKARPQQCIVKIDGVETKVDVKLTSQCTFEEHQEAVTVHSPRRCTQFNEVAVILPPSGVTKKPCLSIAKNYKMGERVYTIGYPSLTMRGERDSDGVSQYASFGQIVPHSQKCLMIKNTLVKDKLTDKDQPGEFVNFDKSFPPNMKMGAIQTTIDAVPGNSGGPLINSKGEIIAVASFADTQKNNEFKQCQGSSFFSPVAGINHEVSHFASNFKLSDVVCKENHVK